MKMNRGRIQVSRKLTIGDVSWGTMRVNLTLFEARRSTSSGSCHAPVLNYSGFAPFLFGRDGVLNALVFQLDLLHLALVQILEKCPVIHFMDFLLGYGGDEQGVEDHQCHEHEEEVRYGGFFLVVQHVGAFSKGNIAIGAEAIDLVSAPWGPIHYNVSGRIICPATIPSR